MIRWNLYNTTNHQCKTTYERKGDFNGIEDILKRQI